MTPKRQRRKRNASETSAPPQCARVIVDDAAPAPVPAPVASDPVRALQQALMELMTRVSLARLERNREQQDEQLAGALHHAQQVLLWSGALDSRAGHHTG